MVGCFMTALSFVLLGPSPGLGLPSNNQWFIAIALVVQGAGSCMVFVPALSAMMVLALERFGHMEGLEDVLSGLLNSSYYMGGGIMPMLGGALTEALGFALSCTVFSGIMAIQGLTLAVSLRALPLLQSGTAKGNTDKLSLAYEMLNTASDIIKPDSITVSSAVVHFGNRAKVTKSGERSPIRGPEV